MIVFTATCAKAYLDVTDVFVPTPLRGSRWREQCAVLECRWAGYQYLADWQWLWVRENTLLSFNRPFCKQLTCAPMPCIDVFLLLPCTFIGVLGSWMWRRAGSSTRWKGTTSGTCVASVKLCVSSAICSRTKPRCAWQHKGYTAIINTANAGKKIEQEWASAHAAIPGPEQSMHGHVLWNPMLYSKGEIYIHVYSGAVDQGGRGQLPPPKSAKFGGISPPPTQYGW